MSVRDDAMLVTGDARPSAYGKPPDNHGCTGSLVQSYLRRRYGPSVQFDAVDVCAFNILQKISRLANTPSHHDSLVDIAGYAFNWGDILDRWDVERTKSGLRELFEDLQVDGEE